MPKKMGNTLDNNGFMSPMNQGGKSKTWPPIMNVPQPNARDPLGVVPSINKGYKPGTGQATRNHRGEKA